MKKPFVIRNSILVSLTICSMALTACDRKTDPVVTNPPAASVDSLSETTTTTTTTTPPSTAQPAAPPPTEPVPDQGAIDNSASGATLETTSTTTETNETEEAKRRRDQNLKQMQNPPSMMDQNVEEEGLHQSKGPSSAGH